jgi:germination protein YpeB
MKQSYYNVSDNICTINCAYAKDDVYYYSDLIKVGVSLSDGKIVSLDTTTYLTNHIEREAFSAKIKITDAQKLISPYLNVKSTKKCVIPKESGKEVQCFEFTCESTDTGEQALVYINAQTGDEEDIMLLLSTDNGTLVK